MNKMQALLMIGALYAVSYVVARAEEKTKIVESKAPSVKEAMDIHNKISVPLRVLEKRNKNALVKELLGISDELAKLALDKVAVKYDRFVGSVRSFEPGFMDSEFKVAYLESWLAMTDKRVKKTGAYKDRLEKIQDKLSSFEKKLNVLKGSDDALRSMLVYYCNELKDKVTLTNEWIAGSKKLFSTELNKLKSLEKKLKNAGVPRA